MPDPIPLLDPDGGPIEPPQDPAAEDEEALLAHAIANGSTLESTDDALEALAAGAGLSEARALLRDEGSESAGRPNEGREDALVEPAREPPAASDR